VKLVSHSEGRTKI